MKNKFHYMPLAFSLIVFFCLSLHAQGGTSQYVYDDNGRLHAVIAPSGETAVYDYDAAGNIVSITRQNHPALSVTGFTPTREVIGNQITVQGTGFIPDASQNTVKFNGVNATVAAATSGELRVVVPNNASPGRISVANANGSAESYQEFVPLRSLVANAPPQPFTFAAADTKYIFRFTGTGGKNISLLFNGISAGLQINITSPSGRVLASGTYNSTQGQNKVFVDRILLPETGDYEIEVSSNAGGTTDLSLYQFDDVTGDIPTDETPLNVSIMRPGQNAVLNLSVSQVNQPTYLSISGSAISAYAVTVRSATGTVVLTDSSDTPNKVIRLANLPAAGSYKVEFDPQGDAAGSSAFKYSLNASYEIIIDGSALSLTVDGSQVTQLTMPANAGQRAFVKLDNGYFSSLNVKIIKPSGGTLDETATDRQKSAIDVNSLPETGTYRILIAPMVNYSGTISVGATTSAAVGGDCPYRGGICSSKEIFATVNQSVEMSLQVVGADDNPSAPVDVEFNMFEVAVAGRIEIYDSSNSLIKSFNIGSTSEIVTFSVPGQYRIKIIPAAGQNGTFKFGLRNLSSTGGS